jgi:hypothetical protein
MRTLLILSLVLFGCSDDKTNNTPPADAAVPADAAAAAPDVAKYCTDITAHCTGANAQYPSMDQCVATAKGFPVGTSNDQVGNTLGCRAYHAGAPSMTLPTTHCIHAGPNGDQVNAAGTCGDACASFCALEIKFCGSISAPIANVTDTTNAYQDLAGCMQKCGTFNKTNLYALNGTPAAPGGDSLACRAYHVTNAALYTDMAMTSKVQTHCTHTYATAAAPCTGTPMP